MRAVLVLVGLLFVAAGYPLVLFFLREPSLAMMLSLYVTMGVFLLLAVRDPAAHRSLIAFAAWSSLAHGVVMGLQVYRHVVERVELIGVIALFVIGIVLIALAPPRRMGANVLREPSTATLP
ncbi:MAG TPA: DUF6632 domain-containing protein [Terracidiphilus sp.]|nr:DUF6632 domain-containing protein [Terracidiphilus sp.]